jgi:hypothetical protein
MSEIKSIGTIQILESIYDVEFIDTGVEGSVGPLLFGESATSHAMTMPPGFYPAHAHPMELMILCVKGECDVFQGEGKVRGHMKPMSLILVPKDQEIGINIQGEEPCDIIVFVAPKIRTREEFYENLRKGLGEAEQ